MSVLALITKPDDIRPVITWARKFAQARATSLTLLCWTDAERIQYPLSRNSDDSPETNDLVDEVNRFIESTAEDPADDLTTDKIEVRQASHPDSIAATLDRIRVEDPELLVAAAKDQSGRTGATYATNPLLRQSPCNTVILFGTSRRSTKPSRVFVACRDNPHDRAAISIATKLSESGNTRVTIARAEDEAGEEAIEVGRRELRQLMRDVGVNRNDRIRLRVYLDTDIPRIAAAANKHDLVLLGAGHQQTVDQFLDLASKPMIAVLKRSPPIRPWRRRRGNQWNPQLSPADYADLIQGLRRGSALTIDFLTMLGLAAAIASLGLLQDSPAVVIGSMLLAPLMTPMIGSGLAVAQANPRLGRKSLVTIFCGFFLTLAISYVVAMVTPGEEITSQVAARGQPNLLDLIIALCSAAAAAYALARPSLVGAVAGVAIATALVPPLCSVGVSLAYSNWMIAQGAAVLFVTNFVAIVLGAAATFRSLGVSAARAGARQRRWVYRTVSIFGIAAIVLAFPLQRALERNIDQGKPQPSSYPLTKAVEDALSAFVAQTPEIEIIATGRPSSVHDKSDVVVILASPDDIPQTYASRLKNIVRREMGDDQLRVEVHCLQLAWQERN